MMFWRGSHTSVTPIILAVPGSICISPSAPALETTFGSKSDSVLITARRNAWGIP
jgi:hypothetical protein